MDDAAKMNSHPERLAACRLVFVDADARVFDAVECGTQRLHLVAFLDLTRES